MAYSGDITRTASGKPEGPVGIGGWMVLPILGLCGTLLWTGYNLSSLLTQWDGIKAIVIGSNPTAAALRLPVGLSTFLGIATMILAAVCLYRIFTYSPTVPRLMTIFYITLVAVTLTEVLLDKLTSDVLGKDMDPSNPSDVLRVVVGAAIWIPYFNRSRRVANTFQAGDAALEKRIGAVF